MDPTPHTLQPGQKILHYTLAEQLGEGGMGQVWRAVDSTLDRAVAIKVLPPAFAADPERMARFEREARLLASLNHPNIATIYSVHVVDNVRYLAMELVPGEDLAQRMARGPIPTTEAGEIALQIARALEAAHESGVVHRDLKPANVRITPDGRVKVLDFGLAKAMESSTSASATPTNLSQSPTFAAMTSMAGGMIVGTAAYMSPEQARGQAVDRRADIWAFGVVLYEMLSGQRAFTGETISDVLAAVLRSEPEREALPADLPPALRTLIERCLEKYAKRRLRDIGEAVVLLEDLHAGRIPATAPVQPAAATTATTKTRISPAWLAVLLTAIAVTAGATLALVPKPSPEPLRKFTLALKDEAEDLASPVVSPNGKQIAYVFHQQLFVRDLGQIGSRALAEGVDPDFRPLWSPDGTFIVFGGKNGLARVDIAGGAVAPICTINDFAGGAGGTWDRDGHLIYAIGHDHLYRVAPGGGVPVVYVARIDTLEADLHQPYMLPGGRAILVVRHSTARGPQTLVLIEDGKRRDLLALESGLMWDPIYDPRGYIIFARSGEGAGVWALPFSLGRRQVTGEPFLIAPEGASPSVAADGNLVYRSASIASQSRVVVVDRSGAVRDTLLEPRTGIWSMALSPDGRQLAMELRGTGSGDIWLFDLQRESGTRFAFGSQRQEYMAWSPDGRMLTYLDPDAGMVMKPADGSGAARTIATRGVSAARITPDGQHVVFARIGVAGSPDIWYASLDGRDSVALVATAAGEATPNIAPQGGYLAYSSDESGQTEVYLRQIPTGEGRWQVSTSGGVKPMWSWKGDRLYYFWDSRIWEVTVELSPTVHLGTPRVLFALDDLGMQNFGRYFFSPTPDPERFLLLKYVDRGVRSRTDAILVENWVAEFGKQR